MEELLAVAILVAAMAGLGRWAWLKLFRQVTVYEYEQGLQYERGRFTGILGPGTYRFPASSRTVVKMDMRTRHVTVPGQEVLSRMGWGCA